MISFQSEETEKLKRGIHLFKEGHYFDAHDVWEDVWQELSGHKKVFWQALIQISVACYHIENGNVKGAEGMLEKAEQKISNLESQHELQILNQLKNLIQKLKSDISETVLSKEIIHLMNEVVTEDLLNYG